MRVSKLLSRGVFAAAALAALGVQEPAHAQLLSVSGYMTAECRGTGGCDIIQFRLTSPGTTAYLNTIRIISTDETKWKFDHLLGVNDDDGWGLGWWSDLDNENLMLTALGWTAATPLLVTVKMAVWTNEADFHRFDISGSGNTQQDGLGQPLAFNATVTPEPASMLLLGTGLAGVVGAARRRRRRA